MVIKGTFPSFKVWRTDKNEIRTQEQSVDVLLEAQPRAITSTSISSEENPREEHKLMINVDV